LKGLPRNVKEALQKSRDSALLAVEIYNKPAITFKSGGYITLMIIAWTSFFHAIFFRRKISPYYRKKNSRRFEKIDGDKKHWELEECLKHYFGGDTQNPVRLNLDFFRHLRNKIEHRSLPEIDSDIFGECQALLLNFDNFMEKEFGKKYCIRQSLSFALQIYPSSENLIEAVKQNPAAKSAATFIQKFRSSLSGDIFQSGQFAFKAFLVQVANHESKDALAIQFVNWDKLNEEQKKSVAHFVTMVKFKQPPIANVDTISAGEVVKRVQKAIGDPKITRNGMQRDKLTLDWHVRCWKKFKIRPTKKSDKPEQTDIKYCIYDIRHKDYGYTQAWVDILIETFRKRESYDELYPKKA
jgi:hypothetical protein